MSQGLLYIDFVTLPDWAKEHQIGYFFGSRWCPEIWLPLVACILGYFFKSLASAVGRHDFQTRSPAVARVGRLYRLCSKASVRLPVAERKRFPSVDYSNTHAVLTLLSNARINARIGYGNSAHVDDNRRLVCHFSYRYSYRSRGKRRWRPICVYGFFYGHGRPLITPLVSNPFGPSLSPSQSARLAVYVLACLSPMTTLRCTAGAELWFNVNKSKSV